MVFLGDGHYNVNRRGTDLFNGLLIELILRCGYLFNGEDILLPRLFQQCSNLPHRLNFNSSQSNGGGITISFTGLPAQA